MKNYYDILEVSPSATQEVIRAAYRALSQRYHPDKNNGDPRCEQLMAEINLAYNTLSDPVKRKLYDEELSRSNQPFNYNEIANPKESPRPKVTEKTHTQLLPSRWLEVSIKEIFAIVTFGAFIYAASYYYDKNQIEKLKQTSTQEKHAAFWSWEMAEQPLRGDVSPQNFPKAYDRYLTLAKENRFNDGRAEQRLAEIFFFGLGQLIDYSKALYWYKKASNAIQSSAESHFMLGLMYEKGLGVEIDNIRAYAYYNTAYATYEGNRDHYQPNPLIFEEQKKLLDGQIGFGGVNFKFAALEKKKNLEKFMTMDEINRAQNPVTGKSNFGS